MRKVKIPQEYSLDRVWVTSDSHFDHLNIIRFGGRPFKDVSHMNEELIKRWNAVVQPNDLVFHCGDVCWKADGVKHLERLNGIVRYIPGNHDFRDTWKKLPRRHLCTGDDILHLAGHTEEAQFILSHYPLAEWPGYYRQYVHLHGHTHRHYHGPGRVLNICVENTNYRPISLTEVLRKLEGKENLPHETHQD